MGTIKVRERGMKRGVLVFGSSREACGLLPVFRKYLPDFIWVAENLGWKGYLAIYCLLLNFCEMCILSKSFSVRVVFFFFSFLGISQVYRSLNLIGVKVS